MEELRMNSSKKKNFNFDNIKEEADFDHEPTEEERKAEEERYFEWLDEMEKNLGNAGKE